VKIALDTNVFVSGIFFAGPPYRILEAWRDRKLQLVLSQEILEEYRRVGDEVSARYGTVDIGPLFDLAAQDGLIVVPELLSGPVCDDRDDDKFISCALAARCDTIVSGDKHLLKVSGFRGIRVLKPQEFVKHHLGGQAWPGRKVVERENLASPASLEAAEKRSISRRGRRAHRERLECF
jgi:uncharacterized protein